MSKIRRVDYSPDEFLSGTSELEVDEKGAYWVVCSLIYSRGEPVADDEKWIATACGCHWRQWRRIRARLLELKKLRLTDDGRLTNSRAERELANAADRVENARAAAQKSAQARAARAAETGSETAQEGRRNGAERPQERRTMPAGTPQDEGVSANINDLGGAGAIAAGGANHQPSTTKDKNRDTPSLTSGRAPRSAQDGKGTRLAPDWSPSEELRAWTRAAITEARSSIDPHRELAKFTDHFRAAPGAKGRKADWDGTWRNWIRKAFEIEGKTHGRQSNGNGGGGGSSKRAGDITAARIAALIGDGAERPIRPGDGQDELELVGSASLVDGPQEPQ